MKGMNWSWADLTGETEGVPTYVRQFCSDFLSIEGRAKQQAHDKAVRQQQKGQQ